MKKMEKKEQAGLTPSQLFTHFSNQATQDKEKSERRDRMLRDQYTRSIAGNTVAGSARRKK